MEPIICDRCFKGGHTDTCCVEVYDIEGNEIPNLSPIPEIQNLETPKPTNFQDVQDEYLFPYDDDDDDDYDKYSEDRWSQKEWAERNDNFEEQERLLNLQFQQEEQEFQYEDHTDVYNNNDDYDNFSKASTM